MTDELKQRLQTEIAAVEWRDLRQHAARGGLFLVRGRLALLEVAVAVVSDAPATVERWVKAELLTRPTAVELAAWESTPERPFESLIAQPFVLARECEPAN